MKGGFKDSPIRMNRFLANLETWNENQIKERAEQLIELSNKVWIYPHIDKETLAKYASEESEPNKKSYSIEDHKHLNTGEPMRPLFDELRKRILNIDSSVKEDPQKLYVAYKSITNFVDIIPQKSALRLSLNIPFDKIKDPQEKSTNVSGKGKWGNGDTEIRINSLDEVEYTIYLVKQAFEYVTGVENGN
jgi:predicted transport protein